MWKKIKQKRKFAALLRQVAASDSLHWSNPYNCAIGLLSRADGHVFTISNILPKMGGQDFGIGRPYYRLWCMSGDHEAIQRLKQRYNIDMQHIRAIEMTNDMSVILRLAARDIYPPGALYKNKKYMNIYLNELADLIEEGAPKKAVKVQRCDLLSTLIPA